jgi:hypothetical protein
MGVRIRRPRIGGRIGPVSVSVPLIPSRRRPRQSTGGGKLRVFAVVFFFAAVAFLVAVIAAS